MNTNQNDSKSIQDKKAKVTEIVNRLKWISVDDWSRPVFLDPITEKFYCSTDVLFNYVLDTKKACSQDKARIEELKQEFITGRRGLYTKNNNDLDGEPDYPINCYSK